MAPVIFSCFAGRERYLRILIPYINQLVKKKLVTDVHMWDYTRNDSDASFLHEACSHFTILVPNSKETYTDYYKYYRSWRYPDPETVLIKSDDDIVYIDVSKFQEFIDERRAHKDAIMFSPAIVNNPVCQNIQKEVGLLPGFKDSEYNLADDADHARKIHAFFWELLHKSQSTDRIRIIPVSFNQQFKFNINFIAILGKDFDILFDNEVIENTVCDEPFLGSISPIKLQRSIYIDMHFIVAHMAFTGQRNNGFDETSLLARYSELVKDLTDTSEGPP